MPRRGTWSRVCRTEAKRLGGDLLHAEDPAYLEGRVHALGNVVRPRRGYLDSSALNRGHEHQRSMRRWNTRDGRPRCFGGAQRGSGTCNDSSSGIVQPWSVIPAAMAGVVLWPAWRLS